MSDYLIITSDLAQPCKVTFTSQQPIAQTHVFQQVYSLYTTWIQTVSTAHSGERPNKIPCEAHNRIQM